MEIMPAIISFYDKRLYAFFLSVYVAFAYNGEYFVFVFIHASIRKFSRPF